jgi:hypothetical protein
MSSKTTATKQPSIAEAEAALLRFEHRRTALTDQGRQIKPDDPYPPAESEDWLRGEHWGPVGRGPPP